MRLLRFALTAPDRQIDHSIIKDIPFSIRHRGIESKIVIPGATRPSAPDPELIKVVSKAHAWFARISKGEAETIKNIAKEDDVDLGDISRFLPLAFLAPDIVEAIFAGKQPVELTAEKLKRLHHLPRYWPEQRKVLGFDD